MEIIVKKSKLRGTISRENKTEWRNEKRAKELALGLHNGIKYRSDNISAMMYSKSGNIRQQHVEKWLKHNANPNEMKLDGKL